MPIYRVEERWGIEQMGVGCIQTKVTSHSEPLRERLPFVSIVLPARNEKKYIEECIASLAASDYPADRLEIIVVDGKSDDDTPSIVETLARKDRRIRLLSNPHRTVPFAMNQGIRAARGEIIVRADAHAWYPPDYVRRCVELLLATDAWNVGGRWITKPSGSGPCAVAISLALTHPFGVGRSAYRVGGKPGWVDTVPFGAFRKEVFERVGTYQECLTRHQDYELNARIRAAGGGILFDPEIALEYYARPSLSALARQKFADGKWCVYSWLICPKAFAFRHAFPGLITAAGALLSLAAWFSANAAFILFLLGGLYSFLALAAGTRLLLKAKRWEAMLTPMIFPVLHFAHGAGVLAGLATALSWRKRNARIPEPVLKQTEGVEEEAA